MNHQKTLEDLKCQVTKTIEMTRHFCAMARAYARNYENASEEPHVATRQEMEIKKRFNEDVIRTLQIKSLYLILVPSDKLSCVISDQECFQIFDKLFVIYQDAIKQYLFDVYTVNNFFRSLEQYVSTLEKNFPLSKRKM